MKAADIRSLFRRLEHQNRQDSNEFREVKTEENNCHRLFIFWLQETFNKIYQN